MKVLTIVGARPQFIKAAPLSSLIRSKNTEILVHTGQHYDKNMSDLFFDELDIPFPDYNLGVGSGSHGYQTGKMLVEIEKVLINENPNCVIVYGDTNSTLAGALVASKLHIPVIHIEAGLRSYNRNMPEETNRVLTDHLSTLLFCPTRTAVNNLAKEGITKGVHFTGDIMYDAVLKFREISKKRYDNGQWVDEIAIIENKYNKSFLDDFYLATIHRAENADNSGHLKEIIGAFGELDKPVLMPIHPRTKLALGENLQVLPPNIIIIEPVGYLLMLFLIDNSRMVLTDSGGLQKEAYFLKTPCTTLREETEWIETLKNGWNVLSKIDKASIISNATRTTEGLSQDKNNEFGDGKAATKMVSLMAERFGGINGS